MGETIKWKIKIVNKVSSMFVGIGLKTIMKNNNFLWKGGDHEKHGCYIVAYNGYSYAYLNK